MDDDGGGILEMGGASAFSTLSSSALASPISTTRPNALKEVEPDIPSGMPGGVGLGRDLHADVLQPCLSEQFRERVGQSTGRPHCGGKRAGKQWVSFYAALLG